MQQKNGSALGRTVCIDASPPGLLSGADTDSALRRYEIVCGEANANGNNKQYKYNNAANNDNQAGNHANKGAKKGYRQNGSIHVQNHRRSGMASRRCSRTGRGISRSTGIHLSGFITLHTAVLPELIGAIINPVFLFVNMQLNVKRRQDPPFFCYIYTFHTARTLLFMCFTLKARENSHLFCFSCEVKKTDVAITGLI